MGSGGGIPDIGVRLSASGVQDVVNAFAKVRQEGKKTGVETSASLELINGALETMEELLPALSFAIVIDKLVDIGLSARESAENLGKLSEKTGAAIGTLSALNLAAHDNEVSQESLSNGLVKLAKNQEDATNGSKKQVKAFGDLGITLKDLKTQDPGQLFITVAEKMATLPDGAQKANVAIALFGKAGAELIPMLKSLGTDGFDAAVAKAKKLGLFLSTDMVESARAAQDALHEIGDIANGVGTQFVAGFAPQFTSGVEIVAEVLTGQGVNSVQAFGEACGKIFKALTLDLLVILDTAKFVFTSITSGVANVVKSIPSLARGYTAGGVAGAVAGVVDYNAANGFAAQQDKRKQDFINSIKTIRAEANVETTRKASTPSGPGAGGSGNGFDQKQQDKTAQARSAFLQAQADNELAILKLKNQLEEAEDKRSYDAGTLTLDQYYDRRAARIKAEADAELAILATKKKAVDKLPDTSPEQGYKKQQAAAAVQTQITETQLNRDAQLKANADNLAKAKHDAALEELNDTEKLKKLSGDKYGAEETALKIELQQYTELLEKQNKSDEFIVNAVEAYRQRAHANIDFGRNQEAGSSAMTNLNLGIGDIQNQAANGSISNIAAQTQINQLQQDSLTTLSAIGLQMFKNAALSGDVKNIDAANQYNAGLQKMASSLTNVTTAQTYLINQLSTQGISALSEFFTAGISGSKSFGDALGDLATSFANIVAKMVSQLLIFYALQELLGLAGVKQSTITSIIGTSPFGKGFDDGGWTGGAQGQIAGIVHGQEFVVKAGPAATNRTLLEALNTGKTPSIYSGGHAAIAHTSSYTESLRADGGVSPSPIVQVINTTGQQTSQKQTQGSGGQSITQIVIGAVAADIAKGGQVAKSLQSNYGVTRQGTKRG